MISKYIGYRKRLIVGLIIVAISGTISHFVYDWTNQNLFFGFFFPINESTWEHMKLAYFPMLMFSLFQYNKEDGPSGYNLALPIGTLVSTYLIPILFYTYKGVLGFGKPWLDISTYYVSICLSGLYMLHIAHTTVIQKNYKVFYLLVAIVAFQGLAFILFTYHPLPLGIFSIPTPLS